MAERNFRWCLCRVLEEIDGGGISHRRPKVGDIEDPGAPLAEVLDPVTELPTGVFRHHGYSYTAAISDGQPGQDNDWCLVQVVGFDFSGLDGDPDVINLFEIDNLLLDKRAFLDAELRNALTATKQKNLKDRMDDAGVSRIDLSPNSLVRDYINRLGLKWNPAFNVDRENVG